MEKEVLDKEEEKKQENTGTEKDKKIIEKEAILEKSDKIKKERKKWIRPLLIIGVVLFSILIFSTVFALFNSNNEKIMTGVSINGINVSGLNKEEAKGKIEILIQEELEKEILIKYEEYETSINKTQIETKYNLDKVIEEAFSYGKKNNIFINNYQIIRALIAKKDFSIDVTINEDATKQIIEDIGTKLPGVLVESSYYIEGENLVITRGKEGIKIETDTLLNKVKNNLKDLNQKEEYIMIPIISKKPEEININKIHEEVYKEVQDAYYTKNPFTIYPEVEGIDFNVEEAKALIEAEEKDEYTIKLTITKPKKTINDFGSEAFPDRLSVFTTRYDASQTDRTTNLRIACQKINGKVILPGETFSYNKTLGVRSVATGYKNAKVYENGEVVDGIGGGICQISSTLYNAVLMANLDIVERRNHQFVTSYVPAGRDATVVYGMTDFRFKNTRKYPVTIKASINNGIATISIYGITEENEYTVSFETRTIATIPTSVKYEEDATMAAGTEKVRQKGANGLKTETYIIKSLNGKVVSKNLLSRDTYDAMKKIVVRGTKGTKTNNNNSNNNNSNNTQKKENTTVENKTDNNITNTTNKTVTDNKTNNT